MLAVTVHAFGPPGDLALEERPDPSPGRGEVVVAMRAVAVNFVDLLVIRGAYQFLPPRPFSPGKLPAGEVLALGAGVKGLEPGARVLTLAEEGGYAEQLSVPAGRCLRLPPGLSYVDAASLALASDTAWFALHERARLRQGETVLVLGASGAVGDAAVQLARVAGARVLAGTSDPARTTRLLEAGADAVIDLSRDELRESLRRQVFAQTEGRGADVIIDPVGGDVFDAALRALAWRGRLVVVGFAAGRIPQVKANYLLVKNIEVSGLQVSDYRKRWPRRMTECFEALFSLYREGKLRPLPARTFSLGEFAAALALVDSRKAGQRVVLTAPD